MSKKVVHIAGDFGPNQPYELLSSRMTRFLEAYPPADGYQIQVSHKDYLEVRPRVADLWAKAIELGRKPAEFGLPDELPAVVVFEARLLDPDGRTLVTASALRPIQSYKDWEKGETAARQRLVAAAGFHGSLLDEDEREDMADQGIQPGAKSVASEEDDAPKPVKPKPTRRGKRGGKKKAESEDAESAEAIPEAMLAQIEHLAKLKGKTLKKQPQTLDEAKDLLKALLAA
ncbi:hypothetical protein [Alcanivorax sp.]|uniref:hypothetical protein n=1 Tax=Alcanivorax sp. TaxID=1872427 RepID=UPI00258B6B00|nr:hypothetical protein [Alcanivorax sp.]